MRVRLCTDGPARAGASRKAGEVLADALDLDDAAVMACFHPGERREGLHYRWSGGDIVLPASLTNSLDDPLMLRVSFEPGTIRGWTAPAAVEHAPKLRLVA